MLVKIPLEPNKLTANNSMNYRTNYMNAPILQLDMTETGQTIMVHLGATAALPSLRLGILYGYALIPFLPAGGFDKINPIDCSVLPSPMLCVVLFRFV